MAVLTTDSAGVRVACPHCHRTNRLRFDALERATRCGQCQTPLPAPNTPVEVADAAVFDAMLAASTLPIAVDFWAPWCGPCRAMAPELDRVAQTLAGRWLVVKVNTDQVAELGERHRIRSIPTLAVFRQGREAARTAGAMPAPSIVQFLERA